MSTQAAAIEIPIPGRDARARPGMGRLTAVELRKMVDTRAGFWLQLAVVALTIVVVVVILLVSSEWSQRTAPITIALVPQRGRILAAKVAASVVLSLIAFGFCLAAAAIGTAIAAPGIEHTWTLPVGLLGQAALSLVTGVIGGVAFGAAFLSSAPAIVLSFALPIGWAAIGSISIFEGAARWLDGSRSLSPLTEHLMSSTEWARAGTTLALWMALPLAIGLWRILRDEVA
jgi:hypothetical protein